mmetsp:Transcript_13018/g.24181  ORF Transcript_13018/g.24181 Transcript_13018/m.24181 type:complete len:158 (+) Transcript_13018:2591-3064(+)
MSRSSLRAKKLSSSMRRVSAEAQQEALEQYVVSLEQDNFLTRAKQEEILLGEDELFTLKDDILLPQKRKKKRDVKKEEVPLIPRKPLDILVAEDAASGLPNFTSMTVAKSRYPRRHFCSICGYLSKYTCVRCGQRFCKKSCALVHRETQCLKFADSI